jgi:hypothetical protein
MRWTLASSKTQVGARATTSTATVTQHFQFIDLSATSTEQKRRNRAIARSHVMKVVRGNQRRKCPSTRQVPEPPSVPSMPEEEEEEEDVETIWSESASRTSKRPIQDVGSVTFAASLAQSFKPSSLSPTHRAMVELDLPFLQNYSAKPTPFLNTLTDFCKFALRFGSSSFIKSSF